MDRCICCGRELDYEGTLVCWECEKLVEMKSTENQKEANKDLVNNSQ